MTTGLLPDWTPRRPAGYKDAMERILLIAALLIVPNWACGGQSDSETTPTDETYTTSGDEAAEEDPPEPDMDEPL